VFYPQRTSSFFSKESSSAQRNLHEGSLGKRDFRSSFSEVFLSKKKLFLQKGWFLYNETLSFQRKGSFLFGMKHFFFLKKKKGSGTRFYYCKGLHIMKIPIIVVNVKAYAEGTGKNALEIAKIMEKVSKDTGVNMVIAVQATDIRMIAGDVGIPVFAQHMDAIKYGSNTGWILPESIKEAGASGVLLNHSEHPMNMKDISEGIKRARELGLETIVCANNIDVTMAAAALSPDFVAIEPPELIGGDISVTEAEPEIIEGAVREVREISPDVKVLCGAGVKRGKDVEKAIELGSAGVLLASGVVKVRDKERVLREMALAIEKK